MEEARGVPYRIGQMIGSVTFAVVIVFLALFVSPAVIGLVVRHVWEMFFWGWSLLK